jgi:HEAT repeat protein
MSADTGTSKKFISRVLNSDELLVKSELTRLSSLTNEEIEYLENKWPKADIKRRRKIISQLAELTRQHYSLDFTDIYRFCLKEKDAKIRIDSINALAEEEDPLLINDFINILKNDTSREVRIASAAALGKLSLQGELGNISDKRTNDIYNALIEVLDDKEENPIIRSSALEAIAPLNKPRVKGLIEEAYHSPLEAIKVSAIRAMGLNCNRMWLTALIDELQSDDEIMRYEAVKASGELAEEDAILYLIELVEDEVPRISEAAIKAIGEIGGEEAREILIRLISDPKPKIRRIAAQALQELELCENPLSMNF